jgi:tetratricopeptide (TPR) repeat protein
MDIAIIALVATGLAFRITMMTTGKQAAAPLNKKKFLTYLGILIALLGYCLVSGVLRNRSASAGEEQLRLVNLTVKAEGLRVAGRPDEAAPVAAEALAFAERLYGKDDIRLTPLISIQASCLAAQGAFHRAEPLRQRALAIAVRVHGEDHPDVALEENNLGALYAEMGKLEQAEPLYRKALAKTERILGQIPPVLPIVLENLAALCERTERRDEAVQLRERAQGFRPRR